MKAFVIADAFVLVGIFACGELFLPRRYKGHEVSNPTLSPPLADCYLLPRIAWTLKLDLYLRQSYFTERSGNPSQRVDADDFRFYFSGRRVREYRLTFSFEMHSSFLSGRILKRQVSVSSFPSKSSGAGSSDSE